MIAHGLALALVGVLPLGDLSAEDERIGIVVSSAVNMDPDDLIALERGVRRAFSQIDGPEVIIRLDPDFAPADCGTRVTCVEGVRLRLAADEVWFLLLARVGETVLFDGFLSNGKPLARFEVQRADLEDPVSYGAPPTAPRTLAPGSEGPAEAVSAKPGRKPVPLATWILGGTSIAALGVGIGFGIAALEAEASLDDDGCAQTPCDPDRIDDADAKAVTADVAFGIAAGTAIAAGLCYWLWPKKSPEVSLGFDPVRRHVAIGGRF